MTAFGYEIGWWSSDLWLGIYGRERQSKSDAGIGVGEQYGLQRTYGGITIECPDPVWRPEPCMDEDKVDDAGMVTSTCHVFQFPPAVTILRIDSSGRCLVPYAGGWKQVRDRFCALNLESALKQPVGNFQCPALDPARFELDGGDP